MYNNRSKQWFSRSFFYYTLFADTKRKSAHPFFRFWASLAKLKSKQALVFLPRPNLCQGPINQRTNCISSIFLDFTSVTPFLHSYSIRARFLFRVRRDKLFSPSISTRWKEHQEALCDENLSCRAHSSQGLPKFCCMHFPFTGTSGATKAELLCESLSICDLAPKPLAALRPVSVLQEHQNIRIKEITAGILIRFVLVRFVFSFHFESHVSHHSDKGLEWCHEWFPNRSVGMEGK